MAASIFGTRKESPSDLAWRKGESPYRGTLGEFKKSDTDPASFRDGWVSKMKDNPEYRDFYTGAKFPDETAALSQEKLNVSSQTPYSSFPDPNNKLWADRFLDAYSSAVQKGVIESDKAVLPENLAYLTTESATSRINDDNVRGVFPSKGVSL